jgi:hypothetical protein
MLRLSRSKIERINTKFSTGLLGRKRNEFVNGWNEGGERAELTSVFSPGSNLENNSTPAI